MAVSTRTAPFKMMKAGLFRPAFIRKNLANFPWWVAAVALIALATVMLISTRETYQQAFRFIRAGISVTLVTTFSAYACALVIGLLTGLGRISQNNAVRNLATFYVEMVRGIPMIVLIFFIALVGVPGVINGLKALGEWATANNQAGIGGWLSGLDPRSVSMNLRAVVALSITYGAFLAEIFRAGIQSVGRGQMEAARSQGMTYWQAMRFIILPQAIRNMMPALGNDFIAMLKDSSLVSVLAVRDITQVAGLYAGQSFRFPEAYTILAVMYLSMTMALSALVKYLERRSGLNVNR